MKKLFKRNQVIITMLAVMIAIAGYINYISTIDADTVETNAVADSEVLYDIYSNDADIDDMSLMEPGTAVYTSASVLGEALISEVKLNREQLRSANKETLYLIIDNTNLDDASKQAAIDEMIKMTAVSEKEMAAELLLEAKGFGECIVTIMDDSVDVVVNVSEIDDVSRAQIEDIVKRKADVSADKITISPINDLQ